MRISIRTVFGLYVYLGPYIYWFCQFIQPLTDIPALTGTIRTDGGRPIWTKFGQCGGYTPRSYPRTKIPPAGPRGGQKGPSNFVVWRNWSGHLSHEWTWIKNLAVWPEGGLKALQNKAKTILDPASFRSSMTTRTFFGAIFALKKMAGPT